MKKITATLALAAVAAMSLTGCQNLIQNDPVICKVTEKDRSTGKDGKSVFRIYTEGGDQCSTFGLADNLLAGNWNASDMYGKIQVGKTYSFKTVGARNGFLSMFPEITKAEEVSASASKLTNGVKP